MTTTHPGTSPTGGHDDAFHGAHRTEEGHAGHVAAEGAEQVKSGKLRAAGLISAVLAAGSGVYWIGRDLLRVEPPPVIQPVQEQVHVKVTRNKQPVVDHKLHIQHGPSYDLDSHGEVEFEAEPRERLWDLTDSKGNVIRTGAISKGGGRLNIDLGEPEAEPK